MAIMQVSRKIDYALRAVIHLANEEASARACSLGEIAERERVPRQFLEKIVQELIHKGLVRSRRGPHGGYVLARPAEVVTFRDVIEAVEGPISLNACVGEHADCSLLGTCGMERVGREGQRRVMELFEKTTIADVRRARRAALPGGGDVDRGSRPYLALLVPEHLRRPGHRCRLPASGAARVEAARPQRWPPGPGGEPAPGRRRAAEGERRLSPCCGGTS